MTASATPNGPEFPLRQAIILAYRRDEAACVAFLAGEVAAAPPDWEAVADRARQLVSAVRRERRRAGGVDQLMHEFTLSSQEGVALMCLAEALLRIPDAATADRLIRDKISRGDWQAHLGHSDSLFVNAAAWGLMITGRLVATRSEHVLGNALTRVIARGGEPVIRRGVEFAMELLGHQFVMAETIDAALLRSRAGEAQGYSYSFDMLGEAALTAADARRYFDAYEQAIHAIGRAAAGRSLQAGPGISVKLSALHPRYTRNQRPRVMDELLARLKALAILARRYGIGLNIDAEEAERLDLSLDLLAALAEDPELAGWDGLGFVVQAYQKRCPYVIDYLIALARRTHHRLMIRLVKGAYWDSEIKRAQVDGQEDYPVYTRKAHTDLSYLACARRLLDAADAVYPQFATHNAHTLSAVLHMARDRGVDDYELQCLHGMGESLYGQVVGAAGLGRRCRIYAPVGSHATLLPYLVRRLLENGANSSFVNRLVDETISIDELVRNPLDVTQQEGAGPHPGIPLPGCLFVDGRRNSIGVDLSNENTLAALAGNLAELGTRTWQALPLVAGCPAREQPAQAVSNPANREDRVGAVLEASPAEIETALATAAGFSREWHGVPREQRTAFLLRTADLLENHRAECLSLCVREAGKTWGSGLAEIREAVDFCRYYGQQLLAAREEHLRCPPGPVVCISPWNFPLSIFVGEVAAALAAGSPVLAKPAEQTPLVAALAVRLFHQAGIPLAALQFLPGRGETVGAALTADPRVRGVIFTGSTETAQAINRSLAGRDVRLVAETGGQNAMIVDSSALTEQVVQDVLASGFDSAGQRCSALRILCLQEDIAERVLTMVKEAMAELVVGDPGHLATDVGPVIDEEARAGLEAHVAAMVARGRRVHRLPLSSACAAGSFVAPTLIEIDSVAELPREVFGPVVHVVRFAGARLGEMIDTINASGYGLTFGLHSRLDEAADLAAARVRAGNLYVNRNMIGAVVGVQPFGGEGKSGTGPKAGGPLYLHGLLGSRDVSPEELGLPEMPADQACLAAFRAFAQWCRREKLSALGDSCDRYAASTLLGRRFSLPGPTGESNTLIFAPRGQIFCTAASEAALLEQVAACLATGNRILLVPGAETEHLLGRLPPEARQVVRFGEAEAASIAAALFAGDAETATVFRQRMAQREGALVPVIQPAGDGRYPLHRLVVERVLTINTTAAGGNASLMGMA